MAPRGPQEGPKRAPQVPEKTQTPSSSSLRFFWDFVGGPWGPLQALEGLPQGPKKVRQGPKRAP
eukprot:166327-Pyramimonas_sp.AAC.1